MAQHYWPEEIAGARLATELAEELRAHGNRVQFVTGAPNHPTGIIYPGFRNAVLARSLKEGVEVLRVWSAISSQKTALRRMLNYCSFSAAAFFGGLAAGKPDVIFSYSPPLPLGFSAWLLSLLWNVPWIIRLEDIFPEAAVSAGVITNRTVIRMLEAMEIFLYNHAAHISVISDGFQMKLVRRGVSQEKISVIPVWADPEEIKPGEKENPFRSENNLEGKFVVLYAGNFGYASNLEVVLHAAEILREESSIQFVLVGEGVMKEDLLSKAEDYQLGNVIFLPYQPRGRYPEMLAAADVGLVTLNTGSAESSMPSKTFSIMASGRPVLAVTPSDSELANLVQQAGCGVVADPDSVDELVKAVCELKNDPQRARLLGTQSRETLVLRYARQPIIRKYEDLIMEVAAKWKSDR